VRCRFGWQTGFRQDRCCEQGLSLAISGRLFNTPANANHVYKSGIVWLVEFEEVVRNADKPPAREVNTSCGLPKPSPLPVCTHLRPAVRYWLWFFPLRSRLDQQAAIGIAAKARIQELQHRIEDTSTTIPSARVVPLGFGVLP
jgi:hypothetical protein